jgi:CubicO group peptidase (beta-lactamase class C family)
MMTVPPESVGLSSARLQQIDRFLSSRYLHTGKLPCAVTLVARKGEIAHFSALGYMDVERRQPVREDTIFRVYSMTKPLTSVAFMMLVEDGVVALEDPVHRHIPQWRELGVYDGGVLGAFRTRPPAASMRIVDLLRHTSGLTYGFQMRTNVDAAYRHKRYGEIVGPVTLDGMIEGLANVPLEFSPGAAWNYSVSTDVIGYLVGKLSGQPFERFLRERILDPLGMRDTDFSVPRTQAHRLAACYTATPDSKLRLVDDPQSSSYFQPPNFVSGGGGLVSTVSDYLRFCRMLLNGGSLDGVRYIGRKTLQLMTSNHLPGGKDLHELSISLFSEATYAGMGFGLGFSVMMNPALALMSGSVGEFAWGGLASTYFWIDPREELIVVFMTQLMPSTTYPVRRELRSLVYSALV